MPIHEHRLSASNISSILSAVIAELGDTEIWFRGQHNSAWPLMPSVFREYSGRRINEAWSLHEFQRRFPHLRVSTPTTTEWLMHMQHYGLPTRLLDWSTSFLVGLYFATTKDDDKDAALFAFDSQKVQPDPANSARTALERLVEHESSWEINLQGWEEVDQLIKYLVHSEKDHNNSPENPWSEETSQVREFFEKTLNLPTAYRGIASADQRYDAAIDKFQHLLVPPIRSMNIKKTILIKPPHVNQRLIAQHGTFTIHGGKWINRDLPHHKWFEQIAVDATHKWADIHKFIIPADTKEALRIELRHAGITHDRLFPEMAEVCETIREASLS